MNVGDPSRFGALGFQTTAILSIVVYLIAIGFAWWGLQEFRFDLFLRRPRGAAAKMLQIFLSIALGYLVGNFFLQYLGFSVGLNGNF